MVVQLMAERLRGEVSTCRRKSDVWEGGGRCHACFRVIHFQDWPVRVRTHSCEKSMDPSFYFFLTFFFNFIIFTFTHSVYIPLPPPPPHMDPSWRSSTFLHWGPHLNVSCVWDKPHSIKPQWSFLGKTGYSSLSKPPLSFPSQMNVLHCERETVHW
jgi:hypothetical protein